MNMDKKTFSSFESVALVLNSYLGPFMMELAAILKERHASTIHLYCKTDILVDQYSMAPHDKLFASVTNFMCFPPALREIDLDEAAELATARDWEQRLGLTYNALAVANRHVGLGYALGGYRHPRSRYGAASYLQMVHAYNVQLGFWGREFENKGITLVLADNKEIASVARMMGVPYRTMARSRYENLHYWEETETREAAPVQRVFDSILPIQINLEEREAEPLPAYKCGKVFIDRAMKRERWSTILRLIVSQVAHYFYWYLKGYEKARGYYLFDQIKMLIRQRQNIRRMMGSETVTLEELEGTPFFFYPLHTEPEQALGQISPEFFFQLEAIAAVSRDLPAGVFLAVKEVAIAAGRRPDNFYKQIMRLKNVVILNLSIPGPEVIPRALGVITIAGTAGLEAALMGKPVISFGRHNPFNFLDHVFVIRDLVELRGCIRKIVDGEIDSVKACSDAARFIVAMKAVSFDMGEFDYINLDRFQEDAPLAAYEQLRRGLLPRA